MAETAPQQTPPAEAPPAKKAKEKVEKQKTWKLAAEDQLLCSAYVAGYIQKLDASCSTRGLPGLGRADKLQWWDVLVRPTSPLRLCFFVSSTSPQQDHVKSVRALNGRGGDAFYQVLEHIITGAPATCVPP